MCSAGSATPSTPHQQKTPGARTGATAPPLVQTSWGSFSPGTVVVDKRERERGMLMTEPPRALLKYEGTDGEVFSLDAVVVLQDTSVLTVERKAWADALQSWTEGKLERQAAAVDLLIIEEPTIMDDLDWRLHDNFVSHLPILRSAMWVEETKGPTETMEFLRRLAARPGGLAVRQNQLKNRSPSLRWRIMEDLPGFNPYTEKDGQRQGDYLEEGIDWDQVADSVLTGIEYYNDAKPDGWRAIGPKTKEKILGLLTQQDR